MSKKVEKTQEQTLKTKKIQIEEIVEEKKKIKMSDIILIVGLLAVVILACFTLKGEKVKPSYELPLALSGEPGLQQLSYTEYQEKVDNDESFVLIIERATCSHCVTFMPIAEQFADGNNVPMYYIDTDTFDTEDWEPFEMSNTYLKKNIGSWGTPTTVVLAGKDAVDYIEGSTSAEKLLELYNKYFEMN